MFGFQEYVIFEKSIFFVFFKYRTTLRKTFVPYYRFKRVEFLNEEHKLKKIMNAQIESLPGDVPIKETKKKDLQAMMHYLDEENRLYFEKILNA